MDPSLGEIPVIYPIAAFRIITVNPGVGFIFGVEQVICLQADPDFFHEFRMKRISDYQIIHKIWIQASFITGCIVNKLLTDVTAQEIERKAFQGFK
jgi:hypothetical protein